MKPVQILVALNVVAWALALFLLLRPGSAEGPPSAAPAGAPAPPEAGVGTSELERIARLQPDAGGADVDPFLGMTPEEVDLFRQRVRRARELNAEEDRVLHIVRDIDRLASEGRIGQLSREEKVKVAEIVMATNYELPGISRRMRERPDIGQMTAADRRQAMRAEYERIRSGARTQLEGVVSPQDAQVIVDAMFGTPRAPTPAR